MKKVLLISVIFVLCILTGFQINDIVFQGDIVPNDMVGVIDILFDLLIIAVLVYEWIKILKKEQSS